MASISRWTILSCAAAASAQFIKRGTQTTEKWTPAQQTDVGIMPLDPRGWTPRPTSAPDSGSVAKALLKRDGTSTCGYYTGYSSSAAVVCQGSAQCIVNDYDSAMGCCASTDYNDCQIYTACLESTEVSTVSATGYDYTLLCTESDYPHCVTYSYDQYDPLYSGYSALGCGYSQALYSVEYYAPFLGSAVTGSTRKTSTRTKATATSGDLDIPGSTSASSSSSSTSDASSTGAAASSSGNNTGAIVGGVVGGVAGLALIALGIFFLIRHLNKKKGANATQQQSPPAQNAYYAQQPGQPSPGPGYDPSMYGPGGPQMSQQQFAGYAPQGGVAYDPRASMAPSTYYSHAGSPKYDNLATGPVSPQGSPPPMTHASSAGDYQAYNPAQGNAQYAQYNQQQGHVAELPASRPDGELRELA